jgi:hypothetical protein
MYYPVQLPFILNRRFAEVIRYMEEIPLFSISQELLEDNGSCSFSSHITGF